MGSLIERIRWNIWPSLASPKGIARALNYGIVGDLGLAAMTGIIALAAPEVVAQVGWPVLTAIGPIYLLLAWFTYRGSRIAAVLAIVILLGGIAYAAVTGQLTHPRDDVKEAAFPFIALLLLVNGVRGAFAYHRLPARTTTVA